MFYIIVCIIERFHIVSYRLIFNYPYCFSMIKDTEPCRRAEAHIVLVPLLPYSDRGYMSTAMLCPKTHFLAITFPCFSPRIVLFVFPLVAFSPITIIELSCLLVSFLSTKVRKFRSDRLSRFYSSVITCW